MLEIHHSGREPSIWWHAVLKNTLETETSNFVLNPSLHWKPVACSEQCCSTCVPGFTEDKSGCMILYALKLIQFIVRDASKKRITTVYNLSNSRQELESQKEHLICEAGNHLQRNGMKDLSDK